jgi:hypothetical protein
MRSRVLLDLLPDQFGLLLELLGLLQSMISIGLLDLGFGLATALKTIFRPRRLLAIPTPG